MRAGEKMKERPILFSGPMVRAILDGRKTQTRRLVKYIPALGEPDEWCHRAGNADLDKIIGDYRRFCYLGVAGERLWVRETWQALHFCIDPETGYSDDVDHAPEIPKNDHGGWWRAAYAADQHWDDDRGFPWRPGIHMPRWASRITLEITEIRVQRLQEIDGEGAAAEGISVARCGCEVCSRSIAMCPADASAHVDEFSMLWDSINGKRAAWASNPWVWALTFKRLP